MGVKSATQSDDIKRPSRSTGGHAPWYPRGMAKWRSPRGWALMAPAGVLSGMATVSAIAAPPGLTAAATIASRGPAAVQRWASESTTSLQLPPPAGVQAGD